MDNFFERYKLPKLNQEEQYKQIVLYLLKKFNLFFKTFPQIKLPNCFMEKFYQSVKEKIISVLHMSPDTWRGQSTCQIMHWDQR